MVLCDPHRRKASVDENYEWDAADLCSQPGDHHGEDCSYLINMQLTFWPKHWWEKPEHNVEATQNDESTEVKVFSHALLFDEYDKDTFTGVTPHRDRASYLV